MSLKRLQRDEGNSSDDGGSSSRKSQSFRSVVLDVMSLNRLQNLMEPVLEPLIRRVVKEEVDSALRKYIVSMKRNCGQDMQPSGSGSLQLQFLNALSLPVFTGTRIEGEGCSSLEIVLVDSLSGSNVSCGPVSSAKVEIVVLEGDFDGDERDDWTVEEFRDNIVREREGKQPLLTGDCIVTLKDGRGSISNIFFRDNSSWTRSRKFRLGARLLDNIDDFRVREARSEPFVVRDHRGELYKKHHPPFLSDEVWRLEKIGKDGAFHKRLRKERVNTVQDFLVLLYLDPTRLRNILGPGMSAKMLEVTLDHARTCVLDKKLLLYNTSKNNGVAFNVVGQVMGLCSNGLYMPADSLSESKKAEAQQMVERAFADPLQIITFDDEPSLCSSLGLLPPSSGVSVASSSGQPSEDIYHKSVISQKMSRSEEMVSPLNYMSPLYTVSGLSTFDDCLQGVLSMDMRYDQHLNYTGRAESLLCDGETTNTDLCLNEDFQYFDTDCLLPSSRFDLSAIDSFIPLKEWGVLLSVLRWCFSIKRIVARKTRVLP